MEIRVLGPFEVAVAGRPVNIGSPKQRAVLALLALQAGAVVSSDMLCDLVWEDTQPASPSATLHSLVSRLRGALGTTGSGEVDGGRELLRTRDPGWVLDVAPASVDALRFAELTARARRRRERGDPSAAAGDLADALALWRGAALVDIVGAGYLASQATRLNEARLDAVEAWADVELAMGRPGDALARLEEHVDANPLRERGWSLLMLALYRLGRQAAALRAFQQARAILREELGIEPSPQLAEVELRILRHDPALGRPCPPPARDPGVWTPPEGAAPPRPTPPPASTMPQPTEAGEFADYTVIVVEDHDFQRRIVVQLLRGLGVGTVIDAANGDQALAILGSGPAPDVIICDIDMPGMDGIEFVGRVAERNLACAMVIASGLETAVLRAVEAIGESNGLHVLAALEKPLTARRLGEVLRQYTRVSRGRSGAGDRSVVSGEELRSALEGGELAARFQPRINLTTGAMGGAEAAAHWRCADGRSVPSSVFLPALAREGLLPSFVDRVVADSCALLAEMGRAGIDIHGGMRVAINVSSLPLAEAPLADRLTEVVQRRGHDPRHFVWELDDIVLARAEAAAIAVLTRLRVKGFGLSMRNAGRPPWTGLLGKVPLTELKLDGCLVDAATADPKRLELLESAVAAARETGLRVVADRCDSQAEFDTLLAFGCFEAQGLFIADWMGASELVSWAIDGYGGGGRK